MKKIIIIEAIRSEEQKAKLFSFFQRESSPIIANDVWKQEICLNRVIEKFRLFLVINNTEDKIVGGILLHSIDYWNRNARIALEISEEVSSVQFNEAMKRFIHLETRLHRVFWLADTYLSELSRKLNCNFEGKWHPDNGNFSIFSLIFNN